MKINWSYCACGCHGYELVLGGLQFWAYQDIRSYGGPGGAMYTASIEVYTGHGRYGKRLFFQPLTPKTEADPMALASEAVKPVLIARLVELYRQTAELEKLFSGTEIIAEAGRLALEKK